MTLELNRLTQTIQQMGEALAQQERGLEQWLRQAREWLAEFARPDPHLFRAAAEIGAPIPTAEPLDGAFPLPPPPEQFTVIGADGSQIQPDRHAAASYYLINVGSLVYRHGSGQTPEARSLPDLRYLDEDLYERNRPVQGNLLDVRRDLAEISHLAGLAEQEPPGPVLALVDGTLLLWVLENEPDELKSEKVNAYLKQLERIRARGGAAVAAFTSRPRRSEVGRLLHLFRMDGDAERARATPNPLERIPDRLVFATLPAGSRSALFESGSAINRAFYSDTMRVRFCYVNVAAEGDEAVIARVEVPRWVAEDSDLLNLVHGGVVAQSRIAGGFPYVLARADELAYISGADGRDVRDFSAGRWPVPRSVTQSLLQKPDTA